MNNLTETVRKKYAEAARSVIEGGAATCGCGTAANAHRPFDELRVVPSDVEGRHAQVGQIPSKAVCCDPITSNLYGDADAAAVPDSALRASLGC